MSSHFLESIDWARPWLAPLLRAAAPIVAASDWREALNTAAAAAELHNSGGLPIRFVEQAELPDGIAYEAFIAATGCVPTRHNLHDFFNALAWLTYPEVKVRLNALQAAEIRRAAAVEPEGAERKRGQLRDAATIFDENAALLITRSPALAEALRSHRWNEIFVAGRAEFERDCEVWLFGHALMEKLTAPYKAITAHTLILPADDEFFAMAPEGKQCWIRRSTTVQLDQGIANSAFTPLPVLGVPGWWPGQDAAFYADPTVFRLPRRRSL